MKSFLSFCALSLCCFVSNAYAESIVAPGHVVYKMPAGDLVTRDVSLEVPARGAGDVILRGSNFESKAHAFKSHEENGRIVFCVVFLDPPGAPANTVAVYKGTYLRGSNLAIYYGDVFAGTYSNEKQAAQALKKMNLESMDLDDDDHPELRYAAGFMFSTPISK